MARLFGRRQALALLGTAVTKTWSQEEPLTLRVAQVSERTARITLGKRGVPVGDYGALLPAVLHTNGREISDFAKPQKWQLGQLIVSTQAEPLSLRFQSSSSSLVQQVHVDMESGQVRFSTAGGPILALGEGGGQFDRRGTLDNMKNGQIGRAQRTTGARVPVPLLLGTDGWAIFFHQPEGTFDLQDKNEGRFVPRSRPADVPLDFFLTLAQEPFVLMREYASLTGFPEMPPLWSFGYQQSHRTLASREEILGIARTFREKRLPCDTLIYLGTGFCPSGWNTGHGSFAFNHNVFPDPAGMIDELHQEHFKVVLHVVYREPALQGTVADPCVNEGDLKQASCYWRMHHDIDRLPIDGWWPDEGDQLDASSRLARNRVYYDGPLLERANRRPFALHRNAAPGAQRFGAFLWSGDVSSSWEALSVHVPVAINTGLSGLPFWGSDTGGFVPTKELTGELYVRWFQFSAFCPLFRSHGRTWKLRLPWQWNTGETGPSEVSGSGSADPDPSELHNAAVEPICRKYLELRYRLMPYLYSAVCEAQQTGVPIMRALWLHFRDDPRAVECGDQYLWGSNILVAPVLEKGATQRNVYLPRGRWHDWWNGRSYEGGREITRQVDLETLPLFVRAGAVIPMGPVKQYTGEPVDTPIQFDIYPGADGKFTLYEDDGTSFNWKRGEYNVTDVVWRDSRRELEVIPKHREFDRGSNKFLARLVPSGKVREVATSTKPTIIRL